MLCLKEKGGLILVVVCKHANETQANPTRSSSHLCSWSKSSNGDEQIICQVNIHIGWVKSFSKGAKWLLLLTSPSHDPLQATGYAAPNSGGSLGILIPSLARQGCFSRLTCYVGPLLCLQPDVSHSHYTTLHYIIHSTLLWLGDVSHSSKAVPNWPQLSRVSSGGGGQRIFWCWIYTILSLREQGC